VAQLFSLGATTSTIIMETKEIRSTSSSVIPAYFVCGSLLTIIGAAILYIFSLMAFESLWHLAGSVESERTTYLVAGLVIAAIAAVGLTIVGFFVTKGNAMPFWYIFVTGIIPGFLLLQGWAAIHAGLAARKGLQVSGLRRVVIITVVVGLLLGMGVFNALRNN